MKLFRYRTEDRESYGILTGDRMVCLPCLAKSNNEELPWQLEEFIKNGRANVENVETLIGNANARKMENASLPIREATLLAPVVFPPKIVCLGLNYKDHIMEQDAKMPDEPIIFMKPHTAITGPKEKIVKPKFVKKLDYEAELAIVVGRKAKNVSVSEAKDCIFGYTILNDVSARDIQFGDKQWTRGKSFDTFAPTGPCITTADQIKDPSNLRIRTWVNEELRQDSTTANMVFNVYEIVHHISRVMTLEPCDLISTGTPKGVGFAMKPEPKFLKDGDNVRMEVEGIGTLENGVVEEG